ncbi:MAG: putative glycolipid-binding domain-containing protein [Acidimicrobiales bacterium]
MVFNDLPPSACWVHQGLRSGFEVSYFTPEPKGLRIEGTTTGFQDGDAWVVSYDIELDQLWKTRRVRIASRTALGSIEQYVESDCEGHWLIDGKNASYLDGCLDIDLEASVMTNALPVHRLCLSPGENAAAPAAYVRLAKRRLERLDQFYARSKGQDDRLIFDYEAPAFDFRCRLTYDSSGLVLDYPGIGIRAG